MLIFTIIMLIFTIIMLIFTITMLIFTITMLIFTITMLIFTITVLIFTITVLIFTITMCEAVLECRKENTGRVKLCFISLLTHQEVTAAHLSPVFTTERSL